VYLGREFRAVFVSTTEATDGSGYCKNHTKSMADQFVFNTVVTRAQSLVVCVGNPYFLFHLENKMQSDKKFWLAYINSCLECETFVYPNSSFSQAEKEKLLNIVDVNATHTTQVQCSGDKIIEGYLNSLAELDEHKRTLKFSKTWRDIHWVNQDASESIEEDEDPSDPLLDPYVKCVIHFQSQYNALANPVETPSIVIHINGKNNLRGAFHESTVFVEVINSVTDPEKKPKLYGKVVKFDSLHNTTFYCEVDNQNLTRFHPINGKDPMFYNLPTLAKIPKGVAVFDLQSLKDIPRIVRVFPPQIAKRRIFKLQFLHWNTRYRCPIGIVVGSVAKGYTFSSGERLLRNQYNFDFCEPTNNIKPVNLSHQHKADKVFTIIPNTKEVFQNAFSVIASNKSNSYFVNFYVVNVAGSTEDRQLEVAKKHGTSACVKTDKLNEWKHYSMFSSKVMGELAFTLGKPRSCFKVSCKLELDVENGTATCKPIDEPIKEAIGILTESYTLQKVESYLDDQSKGSPFATLFQAARCLQFQRISAPYNWLFDVSEAPRAQLILKEFSLWANRVAATKLANSTPSSVPLYHKLPLSKEVKEMVYKEHGDTLQTSLHNKYFLPRNGYKELNDVSINRKFIPLFLEALKNCELEKYLAMLSYDNCFPQLCVASRKFRSVKRMKEFVLCKETDEIDFNHYSHEDDLYTAMFTAPLNSYIDIIFQDMLSITLNCKPSKYTSEELKCMCEKATQDFKRKSEFEKNMFNLQLGVTLKAFNHRIDGYVEGANSKNQLTLSFPSHELETLSENQSSFNVAHLFAIKSSDNLTLPSNSSTSLYEWKVKVASFEGPPSIFTTSSIFLTKDKLKDTNTSADITLYMANEEEDTQFKAELDKMKLVGCVESSIVTVKWKHMIDVMNNPENDGYRRATYNALTCQSQKPTQKESYKQEADKTVFWLGSIKRKLLQKYDILHVWFGAAQDTPLIYPKIQQVEIAPFLKICVQHNSEPEKCFSDVSLAYASKESYLDIAEYIDLWGQVVIAENAVSSVKTSDVLLLENVYLQWPELEYCCDSYNGDYYKVPMGQFIIMKPPLDFTKSSIEIFDLRRGDLLCVQYEVTDKKLHLQMGFVFHMIVERVDEHAAKDGRIQDDSSGEESLSDQSSNEDEDEESNDHVQSSDDNGEEVLEKGEVQYMLKLPEGVGRISEKFNSIIKSHPTCQIQMLHISPPQRYTVQYL